MKNTNRIEKAETFGPAVKVCWFSGGAGKRWRNGSKIYRKLGNTIRRNLGKKDIQRRLQDDFS